MDLKKELIGLRIFTGSFFSEIEKTFGTNTIKAVLNRMGQKPAEIVAEQILQKYEKTESNPFETPSAAFNLFQNTITKLYDTEIIAQEDLKDRYIIRIRNECTFRQVIKNREELKFGGTLCEFTFGYFESALSKLSGLNVEYQFDPKENYDEGCHVNIVFYKKFEEIEETPTTPIEPISAPNGENIPETDTEATSESTSKSSEENAPKATSANSHSDNQKKSA
ncbi:MAG: hypothetical protein ACTSYI_13625 [Promethearchaeota archaeon]